jgi:hypothetical protein
MREGAAVHLIEGMCPTCFEDNKHQNKHGSTCTSLSSKEKHQISFCY